MMAPQPKVSCPPCCGHSDKLEHCLMPCAAPISCTPAVTALTPLCVSVRLMGLGTSPNLYPGWLLRCYDGTQCLSRRRGVEQKLKFSAYREFGEWIGNKIKFEVKV